MYGARRPRIVGRMGELDRVLHRLVEDAAFRLGVVNDPERVLAEQGLTTAEIALTVGWLFSAGGADGGRLPPDRAVTDADDSAARPT